MAEQNKKNVRVQHKIDTSANWASANIVLLKGEIGLESDTGLVKFGNGVDTWNNLPYLMQDELQEIADAINEIGYELEWKADVEFSNLPSTDIARANLMAAPIDHASQFGEYGIADSTYYGHVRAVGGSSTGSNGYAQIKTEIIWVTDLNNSTFLIPAEHSINFDNNCESLPPSLEADCNQSLYYSLGEYFAGVLKVESDTPNSADFSNGAKQTLIIPLHELTYERYFTWDSENSTTYFTKWKKTGTSNLSVHTFELDVPADAGFVASGDYFEVTFNIPQENNKSQILETDEVIVDIIASSNPTIAEYQGQIYTDINQIQYFDDQVVITTTKLPDLDLRLKFLVMRTES